MRFSKCFPKKIQRLSLSSVQRLNHFQRSSLSCVQQSASLFLAHIECCCQTQTPLRAERERGGALYKRKVSTTGQLNFTDGDATVPSPLNTVPPIIRWKVANCYTLTLECTILITDYTYSLWSKRWIWGDFGESFEKYVPLLPYRCQPLQDSATFQINLATKNKLGHQR